MKYCAGSGLLPHLSKPSGPLEIVARTDAAIGQAGVKLIQANVKICQYPEYHLDSF